MSDRILVVGCSYVANMRNADGHNELDTDKVILKFSSGAGNTWISARTIYEATLSAYSKVVVLWSGVNRLDVSIPLGLHQLQRTLDDGTPAYTFHDIIGQSAWYHSGGFGLSGCSDPAPKFLQNFFKHQYLGVSNERNKDNRYLSEQTCLAIIHCQSFLEHRNIPYQMSFIYDCFTPQNIIENIEPGCGTLDRNNVFFNQVNWRKFNSDLRPYEYARMKKHLEVDNFHVTQFGMISWFQDVLNIDLAG